MATATSQMPPAPSPVTGSRRRSARIPAHLDVAVTADAGPHPGVARDLSIGGMFVESNSNVDIGSSVWIECRLSGRGPLLVLPAIVRWKKPGGFGVQFQLLGARDTHALATFIAANRR